MRKFISTMLVVGALMPVAAMASVDITLLGGSVTVPAGSTYSEPGYSAFSTIDGSVTGLVSVSNPGTARAGIFTIGYSVTDSALDSAFASRTLTVIGGSGMIYCSGPMAPGWINGIEGGGCGGTGVIVLPGQSVVRNGQTYSCPDWFPQSGCFVK